MVLALLAVEAGMLVVFAVDWRIPIVLMGGLVTLTVLLDRPVWGVGMMLASRLISTGTTSFFSIGKINIGLFEPVLLVGLIALGLRAVFTGKRLWRPWPWQWVYLAHLLWMLVGLAWCVKMSDGFKDIIGVAVILATATVIIAFVETWEDVKQMLWFWIGTCVFIGLLATLGDKLGLTDYSSQWKAAEGGRETGLGQQPNWFAMNLSFCVHSCAAFALVQKRPALRWGLVGACLFIFYAMMTSGSRGGAYCILIGGFTASLGQPIFRRWFFRGMAAIAVLGTMVFALNASELGSGINRIIENADVLFARDIRGMNWLVCVEGFLDTYGVGIGPGGYIDILQVYNDWLYHSVYRYPHGIFWGEMIHYGVIGVFLLFAQVVSVALMARETIRLTKGTEAEVLAWAMPASMLGYFAWSFVEFSYDEKPFWEWLGLYTALYIVAKNAKAKVIEPIPEWTLQLT
jgi:hypothetical protein